VELPAPSLNDPRSSERKRALELSVFLSFASASSLPIDEGSPKNGAQYIASPVSNGPADLHEFRPFAEQPPQAAEAHVRAFGNLTLIQHLDWFGKPRQCSVERLGERLFGWLAVLVFQLSDTQVQPLHFLRG
jgi:hypothetical protein